uniref:Uncharacterized protein n=1 Tax=Oryza meridionalis TaxID=40149 RepID=A0A0E0CML5_9ORYZ
MAAVHMTNIFDYGLDLSSGGERQRYPLPPMSSVGGGGRRPWPLMRGDGPVFNVTSLVNQHMTDIWYKDNIKVSD